MSVVNRSRRRQKNADWNAAGTIQEVLNKPVVPVTSATVGKVIKLISPNNLGDSNIQDISGRILVNGAFDDGSTNFAVNGNLRANTFIGNAHGLILHGGSETVYGWGQAGTTTYDRPNAYSINVHEGLNLSAHEAYGGIKLWNQSYPTMSGSICVLQITNNKAIVHTQLEVVGNVKSANLLSGTYIPAVTYTHAPAPSIVPDWQYHIVGDWVHVFGDVMITPQGGVSHVITFTLPVPSAFVGGEASGTIIAGAMLGFGSVYALPSGVVAAQVNNQLSMNQRYVVNFKYKIV